MKKIAIYMQFTILTALAFFHSNVNADTINYDLNSKIQYAYEPIVSIPSFGNVTFSLLANGTIDAIASLNNNLTIYGFGVDSISTEYRVITPSYRPTDWITQAGSFPEGAYQPNGLGPTTWATSIEIIFGVPNQFTSVQQLFAHHSNVLSDVVAFTADPFTYLSSPHIGAINPPGVIPPVPLPPAVIMFVSGLLGLEAFRRKNAQRP